MRGRGHLRPFFRGGKARRSSCQLGHSSNGAKRGRAAFEAPANGTALSTCRIVRPSGQPVLLRRQEPRAQPHIPIARTPLHGGGSVGASRIRQHAPRRQTQPVLLRKQEPRAQPQCLAALGSCLRRTRHYSVWIRHRLQSRPPPPAIPPGIRGEHAAHPLASYRPSTALLTMIFTETRRFCALPSGVLLSASGSDSAIPVGVSMR